MDGTIPNMDNLIKDRVAAYRELSALQRCFPGGLPVRATGYMPAKGHFAHRHFDRLSFMFVLRGEGEYRRRGQVLPVSGPCVVVGYPGEYIEYGPAGKGVWELLYINYVAECAGPFRARKLLANDRPVWPIHDHVAVRRRVAEFLDALKDVDTFGYVDRIDRLAELLIVESVAGSPAEMADPQDRALAQVRAYLEQHFREDLDIEDLALENGFSPSGFRRSWRASMRVAPGQFVTQLRIREACRMLVESTKSIGEISEAVGYRDPLYFSRKFRQIIGETASAYRRSAAKE